MPVISPKGKKIIVADGNNEFQVMCSVPTNIKSVQWYKDGHYVIPSNNPRITINNTAGTSQLTVRDIRLSDTGYYQCAINNNRRSSLGVDISVISKYRYT